MAVVTAWPRPSACEATLGLLGEGCTAYGSFPPTPRPGLAAGGSAGRALLAPPRVAAISLEPYGTDS